MPGATLERYKILSHNPRQLPIVEVDVLSTGVGWPVQALVDTGAEYSVFPIQVAQDAGLALPRDHNFIIHYGGSSTAGRKIGTFIRIVGREMQIPIVYVDVLSLPYALLGRRGLFSQFEYVQFSERISNHTMTFAW